jgi:hypothetical protein
VLQGDPSGLSSREAALARWSRQVVLDSNAPTQADVDHLRDVGFSDREIFEATAFIAFRLAFSTIDNALGAPPDQELIERVPPVVRKAVTNGRPRTGRRHGRVGRGYGWTATQLAIGLREPPESS